ncbi:MAG TPA: LacI family DNA-binding transcriptional regulator [Armatimonadota bacterium]|jgi:DNA-binding LacI/PurR family transcriptional regulator
MTTLRQLAQIANVSPSTVSMALRGNPAISAKTRERIRALADLYHYQPRSLMPGQSCTIGFLIGRINSPFFSNGLAGVMRYAFEQSYHVDVLENNGDPVRTTKAMQIYTEQGVDGIMLMPGNYEEIPDTTIRNLWAQGIPLVRIGRGTQQIDQAYLDDDQLAELVVDHLISLGHRTFAYMRYLNHSRYRLAATEQALRRRGLSLDYCWDDAIDPTFQQMRIDLRTSTPPPTAIIAQSPSLAIQFIQIAGELGIRVPRDVSTLAFVYPNSSESSLALLSSPPLTTVEVSMEECGRQACALLIERIQAKAEPASVTPRQLLIPGTLIDRASCAAPGRRFVTRKVSR